MCVRSGWKDKTMKEVFFGGGGIVLVEVCVRVCVSIIHDKRASVCMFFVCAVTMRKP